MTEHRLHVVLACAGLDHARRGFESFARECFEALRDQPGLRLELLKGSGPTGPAEARAPLLRRDRLPARVLARALRTHPFRVEHTAFALGLLPLLARRRPDLVYLSEWDTAKALALARRPTGLNFRLLLSNGTFMASGFEHLDHVQELTPAGLEWVIERGADPRRHSVLPLGFRVAAAPALISAADRAALRARLGLPAAGEIVISVAALNRTHKRLDYLIEELAALPAPRPFLLLVGQPDGETASIRALAHRALDPGRFALRTVPAAEVTALLRASDHFVLSSIVEAQGRALIEAAAEGLPCLAHDGPVTRYAVGDAGLYADLHRPGALTELLRHALAEDETARRARALAGHRHVFERFSWTRLAPRYVELFSAVANSTVSSSSGE